jgi:oxepin-CoA hydrolase/3-oxo-5,6-dehydrosuberyl-CoA semialdehyde dehydrogenase
MTDFLEPNLEIFLGKLTHLSTDTSPEWGSMNAQQMIEHLSNSVNLSMGKIETALSIPEDKVAKAVEHLYSDKPMPRGYKASYAPEKPLLRNEELELSIDEFATNWIEFEAYFSENPSAKHLHPVYGILDHSGWLKMHSKHFTHHFEQFGL